MIGTIDEAGKVGAGIRGADVCWQLQIRQFQRSLAALFDESAPERPVKVFNCTAGLPMVDRLSSAF